MMPVLSPVEFLEDLSPTPAGYRAAVTRLSHHRLPGLRTLRVAIAASFRAETLADYLRVEGVRRGFNLALWFTPYGQFEIECGYAGSALFAGNPEAVVIATRPEDLVHDLWHQNEPRAAIEQACERVGLMIANVRRSSAASIVVLNYTEPLLPAEDAAGVLAHANAILDGICHGQPGVFRFDFARMALEMGLRQLYDARLDAIAHTPFSVLAQIEIARRLARLIRAIHVPPIKCLVLDLDNTLWGGVIGEAGLGGIEVGDDYPGSAYRDFQQAVRVLRDRGILLAVASRNDESEAREALERHPGMMLRWEDFAATEIHWQDKAASLRRIAESLRIGLDSLAFYDDDPVQRESIRSQLPAVTVIDVPVDPLLRSASLLECEAFDSVAATEEDRQRAAFYERERQRDQVRRESSSLAEFLTQLRIRATAGNVDSATLPRVAQLINKTNQFNLTARRYTEAEIHAQLDSGAIGIWLRVTDRFGDYGLVGAAFALPGRAGEWRIDSFVLSCRILGRQVETALLAEVARRVQKAGGQRLAGEYIPTARNSAAADFFASHGFEPQDGRWVWAFTRGGIETPATVSLDASPAEAAAIE
jgi:FkbH-like protein